MNNPFDFKKECKISIGDIFLKQGSCITETQFLATSRSLDVERYCIYGLADFPYKNEISKAKYGIRHNETIGNRNFKAMINSFEEKGYNMLYPIHLNRDGYLIDGNHRCGACIYFKIEELNAKILRYGRKVNLNINNFIRIGLNDDLINQVLIKFDNIQRWLIKTGNTFAIKISGFVSKDEANTIIRRVGYMCLILSTIIYNDLLFIQFSVQDPLYICHNNRLISVRCIEIEKILKKNFPSIDIIISKSCYEGRLIYHEIFRNVPGHLYNHV